MEETIESPHNPRLKELRKLQARKHRERTGLFMAEGEDMLAEALRRGAAPRAVFYDAEALDALAALLEDLPAGVETHAVSGPALRRAGTLGSGSRVIGVWPQRSAELGAATADSAVYLHEVADPGNVGTVLRSALAFGSTLVVVSPASADPFGPKSVRASMGAIFGQPVARADFEDARAGLGERWKAVALAPRRGTPLHELDHEAPCLYCLGSERTGLPPAVVDACEEVAHVPLREGGAESLNVAMTATLCLYERALALSVHRLSSVDG